MKKKKKAASKKPTVFSYNPWKDRELFSEPSLYANLGLPEKITYRDYLERYKRQDVAHRVIKAPSAKTWVDSPVIYDNTGNQYIEGKENRSAFEKEFDELSERLNLFKYLYRLDILASLGTYAVLLLGYSSEFMELDTPVSASDQLMFIKPYGEDHIQIMEWDYNPTSERYGHPEIYQIQIDSDSNETKAILVHWTRILHVVIDPLEEDLFGIPSMEPIYNRLVGLDKIAGAAPEGYYLGARGGFICKASDDAVRMTDDEEKDIKRELDLYFREYRRTMTMGAMDIQELKPQVVSPLDHIEAQLKLISAQTQIPMRILTGSERGELASNQDERAWLKYIEERREHVGDNSILTPLVKRLIENGTLPAPVGSFRFEWEPLLILSDEERANIGFTMIKTLDLYASNPTASAMYPPEFFFKDIFNKSDEEVLEIERASNISDDDAYLDEDDDEFTDTLDIEERIKNDETTN